VVRLTGGEWRGRRLEVPDGIRPTTELARKAAFDILGDAIRGARVLDVCAGSGAYGLEALSRGAVHATFVESNRGVAEILRGNVERLGAGARAVVHEMSVRRFSLKGEEGKKEKSGESGNESKVSVRTGGAPLAEPRPGSFDVIFHDPPFEEISDGDLPLLLPFMRPGGWLFHERGDDRVLAPGGVSPVDVRRYGLTRFLIYRP
jgi:16S rRNA (guanine966-N2)-methyltransferase